MLAEPDCLGVMTSSLNVKNRRNTSHNALTKREEYLLVRLPANSSNSAFHDPRFETPSSALDRFLASFSDLRSSSLVRTTQHYPFIYISSLGLL